MERHHWDLPWWKTWNLKSKIASTVLGILVWHTPSMFPCQMVNVLCKQFYKPIIMRKLFFVFKFQIMNNRAKVSASLSKWFLKTIHVGFMFLKPDFLKKKMKFILIFYLQSISTLSKTKHKPLMLDVRPWWTKLHPIVFMGLTIW